MTGTPIRVGIIGAHPERGWAATAHLPDVDLVVIGCGTSRRYRQWYNRGRRIRERC
jgi:hypothetical protein